MLWSGDRNKANYPPPLCLLTYTIMTSSGLTSHHIIIISVSITSQIQQFYRKITPHYKLMWGPDLVFFSILEIKDLVPLGWSPHRIYYLRRKSSQQELVYCIYRAVR